MEIRQIYNWINSCFQWENVPRSIIAFIAFLVITYYFELFMVPLFLLLIFLRYYIWNKISSYFNAYPSADEQSELLLEGDEDDDKDQGVSLPLIVHNRRVDRLSTIIVFYLHLKKCIFP